MTETLLKMDYQLSMLPVIDFVKHVFHHMDTIWVQQLQCNLFVIVLDILQYGKRNDLKDSV